MTRTILFPLILSTACTTPEKDMQDDTGEETHDTSDHTDTNFVDNDEDGVYADEDCNDSDPNMPNGDADCDGIPVADDCDDTDPSSTTRSEDTDCDGVLNSEVESICYRWSSDRADLSEGTWNGSVNTCDAGLHDPVAMDNALRLVNLFRWISGLSEVETLPTLNEKAQECSLILEAYDGLTHYPQENFSCYTEPGAQAAASSNISPYAGVYSVDLYMSDPGNSTTLGHRRWILSNSLGPIGLGSTTNYSCMLVIGGSGTDNASWTAWPPPGVVPFELTQLAWATLDETGWSVQSDSINLGNANVTITRDDGTNLPVVVTELAAYYGSQWAISMIPSGWEAEPGRAYDVHIEASGGVIDYAVDLVDCDSMN